MRDAVEKGRDMNGRILIADHDAYVRHGCQRFLTSRGLDVSVVANGPQCVDHLKEWVPNVLILDPEILWGGRISVLAWLKEEAPLCDIAVGLMEDASWSSLPQELNELVSLRLKLCHRMAVFGDFAHRVQKFLNLNVTNTQEAEIDGETVTVPHTSDRIVP